ncbi:MAG: division/cell wall cluster transcriptional repressor MraZ [Deltaproteobacteria bacterium]|nr:division/cell wall cluster transcriptional repressor MraZ [Deltaproteobacteria bacterium]
MFRGIFETTIDAKGRTSLPARFREVLVDAFGDERFFVTNSYPVALDSGVQCSGLLIFPYKEWFQFEENFLNSKGLTSAQRNSIMHTIVSPAMECSADKLGRILVPPHLRKIASLEREIVFVGALKKAEIWSQPEWDRVRAQDMKNFPTGSEAAAELGL